MNRVQAPPKPAGRSVSPYRENWEHRLKTPYGAGLGDRSGAARWEQPGGKLGTTPDTGKVATLRQRFVPSWRVLVPGQHRNWEPLKPKLGAGFVACSQFSQLCAQVGLQDFRSPERYERRPI